MQAIVEEAARPVLDPGVTLAATVQIVIGRWFRWTRRLLEMLVTPSLRCAPSTWSSLRECERKILARGQLWSS